VSTLKAARERIGETLRPQKGHKGNVTKHSQVERALECGTCTETKRQPERRFNDGEAQQKSGINVSQESITNMRLHHRLPPYMAIKSCPSVSVKRIAPTCEIPADIESA
jgi:hypothetical protein